MSKKPETLFKEKVLMDLKTLPHVWVVKTEAGAVRGTPDILACVRGTFVALELKVGKNLPDKLQTYNVKKINESGGHAWVVYPHLWPSVFEFLSKHL